MRWIKFVAGILTAVSLVLACSGARFSKEMSRGERLFRSNCASCHTLPNPAKYTDIEWPALVNRYAERTTLNESEREKIIEYLITAN